MVNFAFPSQNGVKEDEQLPRASLVVSAVIGGMD